MISRKSTAVSSNCVKLRKVLGFSHKVKNGVVFSDPNTLFYLSGQQGVFHDLKTHHQTFQPININTIITALCLNANRILIACSKGPDRKVTVINLSSGETRTLPKADKVISDEYVAVSFSADEERLGAQGGYPDWAFVIWQWKKHQLERVFHPIRLEPGAQAYNFSFCPNDLNKIVVFGHKFLRIYMHKDEPQFQVKFRDEERAEQTFHSYAWKSTSPLHLLIGNSLGEILVIESNTILRKVSITDIVKKVLKINDSRVKAIRCLLPSTTGFKCSYGEEFVLYFDEKHEIQKILKVPYPSEKSQIVQLITNSTENIFVVATEDGQILTHTDDSTVQVKLYEEEFTLLFDRQHIQNIVCSDTVLPISLQATCSDIAIIIRNVFSGIVHHRTKLNSVPICVSLHPLGINVLIGFDDEWRAYNILHDMLKKVHLSKEPGISMVCFSPNGGYIGVVALNSIRLHDSITFHQLITYEYMKPKIEKLIWRDDFHLLTTDVNGMLREWTVPKVEVIWTYSNSTPIMAMAVYLNVTFVSTSDCKLIRFNDKYQAEKKITLPSIVTAIIVWKDLLVTGSKDGVVRVLEIKLQKIISERRCHLGNIILLAACQDIDVFVAVGRDGTTSFWTHADKENISGSLQDDMILVHINEHKKLVKQISELETTLNTRFEVTKKELAEQESFYESTLQHVSENHKNIQLSLKYTLNNLLEELKNIQSEQESTLQQKINTVRVEIEEKEEHFQKKISDAKELYERNLDERERAEDYYKHLIAEKEKDIKDSTERFGDRYQSYKECLLSIKADIRNENKLQNEIEKEREKFLTEWTMGKWNVFVGSPAERELKRDLRKQQKQLELEMEETQRQLSEEKKRGIDLDAEIGKKNDEYTMLLSEIGDIKFLTNQSCEDISRLERVMSEYRKGDENLRNEMTSLKAAGNLQLTEHERELEMTRKELDDVKNELFMNEEKLNTLTKQLKRAKSEECHLIEKLKTIEKIVHDSIQQLRRDELLMERYRNEFVACTSDIPSTYALRWAILRLYDKNVVKNRKTREENTQVFETDLFSRYIRQRDNYESLINVIQSRNDQIKESNRQSFVKLAQENSAWTAYAESLRVDIKNKKERIACLEESLGLKADEFSANPAETQKRLQKVAETFQRMEEKESNEIEKRMNLIQTQAAEILRLHALLNVEERNKIIRRDVF